MLITNHVLSGAVIGSVTTQPLESAAKGFISHFVLDSVPHFGVDPSRLLRIAVPDGLVGLALIALIAARAEPARRTSTLAGIFGACLPDIDKPARQFFGRSPFPQAFDALHAKIQPESPRLFPVELAVAVGLAAVLARLLRRQS